MDVINKDSKKLSHKQMFEEPVKVRFDETIELTY